MHRGPIVTLLAAGAVSLLTLSGCASPRDTAAANLEKQARDTRRAQAESTERYAKGRSAYDDGDVVAASKLFAEAASLDSRNVSALMGLGVAAYHLERWGDAVRAFEAAGQLAPARPEPRMNLGTTLERVGRIDQAIEAYEVGLALDPGNLGLQENLARAFVRARRDPERVAELVETALEREYRNDWRRWLQLQAFRLGGQEAERLEQEASLVSEPPEPATENVPKRSMTLPPTQTAPLPPTTRLVPEAEYTR